MTSMTIQSASAKSLSDASSQGQNLDGAVISAPVNRVFQRVGNLWVVVLGLLVVTTPCWAQAPKAPAKPAVTAIEDGKVVMTSDGFELRTTYYKSKSGKDAAVAVLVHARGGKRQDWGHLAKKLQEADIAVVAVDLRYHGESETPSKTHAIDPKNLRPTDFQAFVKQDLEAVKEFLLAEHQAGKLNIRRLGLVGTEMSGPIAMSFAEFDWAKIPHDDAPSLPERTPRGQDVQALVLISPDSTVPGFNVNQMASKLRQTGMATMICVAENDREDHGVSKRVHDLFQPKKVANPEDQKHYLLPFPGQLRGLQLFGNNSNIDVQITGFLKKFLVTPSIEWSDRRSRLER